jgi:hypothetical protein
MNIHPDMLSQLKAFYTPGTRVRLVHMDDPYTKLTSGATGTVSFVDDIGTVHVNWDCGGSLGVLFGEDEIKKID